MEIGCLSSDSFCGLMGGDFSTFTSLGEPASIMYTALLKTCAKEAERKIRKMRKDGETHKVWRQGKTPRRLSEQGCHWGSAPWPFVWPHP